MNPTYKLIPASQLLASIKVDLRLTDINTEDLYLKRQMIQAINEMSTTTDFIEKTETLEIDDNFCAELPCDFVTFDRGNVLNPPLIFTVDGQIVLSVHQTYFTAYFNNQPFINNSPYPQFDSGVPTLNIQNGTIYFSTNIPTHQCKISYLAVNTDSAGNVLIPAGNERAISNYVCYRYHLSLKEPQNVWWEYKTVWTNCKLAARGQSQLLDTYERALLTATMNSLFI